VAAAKKPPQRRCRNDGERLKRLRTAAGVAAFAAAGVAVTICSINLSAGNRWTRSLAAAVEPVGGQTGGAPSSSRNIDAALRSAAADEFGSIVNRGGGAGAHRYLRQCLAEVAAAPRLSILDYCIAFENSAAMWESKALGTQRYFAKQQRAARYRSLTQAMRPGITRDVLLQEADRLERSQP
jgi:hypothetical protein